MDSIKQLNNFNAKEFLAQYWQQNFLLIEQGLPNLALDFDQHDLAGLSLEEGIDSRIISQESESDYQFLAGPFEESTFANLGNVPWTLLVQSVDHFVPDVAGLKDYFSFLPAWRLDDIMVSYATQGGSVGPHYDYYDVFLIQLKGQRRWQLGQMCDDSTALQDHADLKLLDSFEKQEELLLDEGDILYVPPGLAHWGVAASDDCMTISVGFRAPSYSDVVMGIADDVMLTTPQNLRYSDAAFATEVSQYEIPRDVVQQVQAKLLELALDESRVAKVFAKLMTEPAFFDASASSQFSGKLKTSQLYKNLDARLAFVKTDRAILLFANGQVLQAALAQEDFIKNICAQEMLDLNTIKEDQQEIVGQLINWSVYDLEGELDDV